MSDNQLQKIPQEFFEMTERDCKFCTRRRLECPDCGKRHLCRHIVWFMRKHYPEDMINSMFPEVKEMHFPFIQGEKEWTCSKYKRATTQEELRVWNCEEGISPQLTDVIHPDQTKLFEE